MTDKQREQEARSLIRDTCKVLEVKPTNGQVELLVALFMSRTIPCVPTKESNSERSVREMDEHDAALHPARRCATCGHADVWHRIGVGPCNKLDTNAGKMCTCLEFVRPNVKLGAP